MAGANDLTQQTPAAPVVPRPAPPAEALAIAEPAAPGSQSYFCLEASHPGVSGARADAFDIARMFSSNERGAPTCPSCKRTVSAIPVDDAGKLPPSIQATKDRLEIAERQR